MPSRPPIHKTPGQRVAAARKREHDKQRGSSAQRGYSYRWQQARKAFLSRPENALCVYCLKDGRTTAADTVDHIVPHRGDQTLMWSESNWQALCSHHHNSTKKSQEMTGRIPGCDAHGNPNDPNHPWRRGTS